MSRKDKIKFNHAVVLVNAVKLDIVTLDFRDASRYIACIAIYARFQRQNGDFIPTYLWKIIIISI